MWFRRIGRGFAASIASLMPGLKIFLLILVAHGGILFWLLIDHCSADSLTRSRPLTVRTIRETQPLALSPSLLPSSQKSSVKQSQNIPSSKKTSISKTVSSPLSGAAGIAALKLQALIKEFDIIAPSPTKSHPLELKLPTPPAQSTSIIEKSKEKGDESYEALFTELLRSNLQLPEIGQVRVRIVVEAAGKIASFEILDSRSERNAAWLKNQLPLLETPCFNDRTTREFTILFRNE